MRMIDADTFVRSVVKSGFGVEFINRVTALLIDTPTIEPMQGEWIPCSERLPEKDKEVLVYLWGSPYIAWIYDGEWHTEEFNVDKDDEPIAWMPLPEPWKGADDGEMA